VYYQEVFSMARRESLPEPARSPIVKCDNPAFETVPWEPGPILKEQRVVIVSTAALHRREDRPFAFDSGDH
jgi:D-proline reductase (dithiol) PrdB